MLRTDRKHFVLNGFLPYKDAPSPLGHGATISAPHMHALYVELLCEHLVPVQSSFLLSHSRILFLTTCLLQGRKGSGRGERVGVHDGSDGRDGRSVRAGSGRGPDRVNSQIFAGKHSCAQ